MVRKLIPDYKNDGLCYAAPTHLIKFLTEIILETNYIPSKFVNQKLKIKNECKRACWLFVASFDKALQERDWIWKGLAGLQAGVKGKSESRKLRTCKIRRGNCFFTLIGKIYI